MTTRASESLGSDAHESEARRYPRKMRDLDIRLALDEHIRATSLDADGVLRHEVGLEEGHRRIDVAAINGHLHGWEIKSDVDTLVRLAGQAESYNKVFDFVTLVTTDRYLSKARAIVPSWWGLTIARAGDLGPVTFRDVRKPKLNRKLDKMALAQLLWRDETLDLLRELGHARGLVSKPRWFAWLKLAEVMPTDELAARVRAALRARPEWPGGELPSAGGGSLRTHATP